MCVAALLLHARRIVSSSTLEDVDGGLGSSVTGVFGFLVLDHRGLGGRYDLQFLGPASPLGDFRLAFFLSFNHDIRDHTGVQRTKASFQWYCWLLCAYTSVLRGGGRSLDLVNCVLVGHLIGKVQHWSYEVW